MSKFWMFVLLAIPISGLGQNPPDGTNRISVSGISFSQLVDSLMERGYQLKWVDNNHRTIRTSFREAPNPKGSGSSFVYVSIRIKMEGSTARITAKWYDAVFVGNHKSYEPLESDLPDVTWAYGDALQLAFKQMDDFAKSLGKQVAYETVP